ncbi:hypothetical protein X769_15740 [Mesorhizobium sp. LSJC268A00]|uniref:hypothetical protein n=1 Tax=unclassified Mesorhizobium TaxID=325217 RepID=UPI0003CF6B29|nr:MULTISPECIES: hypothetical protein [unclassified Mesorhizobium]ESX03921.1 hypothetical protein X769_15740 [Mesorhizobium sp. LSJC268A00]
MEKLRAAAEIAAMIAADAPPEIRTPTTMQVILPFVAECLPDDQIPDDCDLEALALPIAILSWQRLVVDLPGCCGDDDADCDDAQAYLRGCAAVVFQTYSFKRLSKMAPNDILAEVPIAETELPDQEQVGVDAEAVMVDEFYKRAGDNPFVTLLRSDDLGRCLADGAAENLLPSNLPAESVLFVDEMSDPPFGKIRLPTLSELEKITDLEERAWAIHAVRLNATCERSQALIESVIDAGVVGLMVQAGFSAVDDEADEPRHRFYSRRRSSALSNGNLFVE